MLEGLSAWICKHRTILIVWIYMLFLRNVMLFQSRPTVNSRKLYIFTDIGTEQGSSKTISPDGLSSESHNSNS